MSTSARDLVEVAGRRLRLLDYHLVTLPHPLLSSPNPQDAGHRSNSICAHVGSFTVFDTVAQSVW